MNNPLSRIVLKFAGKLRFPYLFLMTAALFVLDFFVPDPFPFADELLLGLLTLLFGSLRKKREPKTAGPGSARPGGRLP